MISQSEGGAFSIHRFVPTLEISPGLATNSHGIVSKPLFNTSVTFTVAPAFSKTCCGRKGPVWFCQGRLDGCTEWNKPIFGHLFYAVGSSVCGAALHSGTVGPHGGVFVVTHAEPENTCDSWPAIHSNGISSTHSDTPSTGFATVPLATHPHIF